MKIKSPELDKNLKDALPKLSGLPKDTPEYKNIIRLLKELRDQGVELSEEALKMLED